MKKNPQDKYYEASKRISGGSAGIIDENVKQGKCHGKTTGHLQAMRSIVGAVGFASNLVRRK